MKINNYSYIDQRIDIETPTTSIRHYNNVVEGSTCMCETVSSIQQNDRIVMFQIVKCYTHDHDDDNKSTAEVGQKVRRRVERHFNLKKITTFLLIHT